jgi:hypothetical protein
VWSVRTDLFLFVGTLSLNKIITKQNLNDTRFLLMKLKLNMRKTTPGQPNLGYPLFRRQD